MDSLRAGYRGSHRATTVETVIMCVLSAALMAVGLTLAGCAEPPESTGADAAELSPVPESDDLRQQLDEALLFTYRHRHLNLTDHAAWQILHGVLTYKQDFLIRSDSQSQDEFSAVEYILGGGEMEGWTVRPGDIFTQADGRRGLRAVLEAGSNTGQGHYDQWLAVLAQCDLPPTQEIHLHGQVFIMEDFINQVLWDVPNRRLDDGQYEFSWTLIGLTNYLPTDYSWTARDGETWSIERMVQIEAEQARENLSMGACGGTHRLIGLTMALKHHLDEGGEMTDPWLLADEVIRDSVDTIRKLQNADGSFSSQWLERPGLPGDIDLQLGCTGHQLEFLTLALSDEEDESPNLEEPWVKRAVANMCNLIHETRHVSLKCGELYHATHGLDLYRQRVYERVYGPLAWNEEGTAAEPGEVQGENPPLPPGEEPAAAKTERREE